MDHPGQVGHLIQPARGAAKRGGGAGHKPLVGLISKNLVRGATAGGTLLAIAIPLNIGSAQIAGLPPTAGLYALVLPSILYALTVSSRQVVASPDAAAAALVASSVGALAVAGSEDYLDTNREAVAALTTEDQL
jgi:MFS superfamily sulfate permease-like transporter